DSASRRESQAGWNFRKGQARASLLAPASRLRPVTACAPSREISRARDRLPVTQPLCDQLGAFPIVASIEDAQVLRIGAQIDTGRPRADFRVGLRPRCEVSGPELF